MGVAAATVAGGTVRVQVSRPRGRPTMQRVRRRPIVPARNSLLPRDHPGRPHPNGCRRVVRRSGCRSPSHHRSRARRLVH